jgi:hypothetical protein
VRPRAICDVPGLDPTASPAERFQKFARMIVSVPKEEADREMKKSGLRKKPKSGKRKATSPKANEARLEKKAKENGHKNGASVSDKLFKNLVELTQSIEKNSASVRRDLAQSGKGDPDEALVTSAAKYNEALKRLAKE